MAKKSELEAGLEAMAQDFVLLGGGRLRIARLVANHLNWFDAAEARGMAWRDMARALATADVTDRHGNTLSTGTLSSAVWRARDRRSNSPAPPQSSARKNSLHLPAVQKSREGPFVVRQQKQPTPPAARSHAAVTNSASSPDDVLGFMKRAAALRKGRDD
jgi:hypothetical protein